VFFTQDKLDDEGYPVRNPESSSYLAATFADLVEAEGIRRGAHHIRQLTIVGDGAAWIWDIATGKFSEATQIVDIWHAREHLHDLARVLELMLGDQRDEWLAARLDDLDAALLRAARPRQRPALPDVEEPIRPHPATAPQMGDGISARQTSSPTMIAGG
jgi:hypothetical protein